jgi:hypothetical protein
MQVLTRYLALTGGFHLGFFRSEYLQDSFTQRLLHKGMCHAAACMCNPSSTKVCGF